MSGKAIPCLGTIAYPKGFLDIWKTLSERHLEFQKELFGISKLALLFFCKKYGMFQVFQVSVLDITFVISF